MVEKRRGLGRGFDSLIPTQIVEAEFDVTAGDDEHNMHQVACELIDPNPHQPRTEFDEAALQALAASIRVHGILQPLVVTKQGNRFELIAGERRLRAARIAGLDSVPVIVRSFDEQEKLELALIENIQREDLNPLEVATAYRKLTDQFNLALSDISEKVGRAESTISNTMRLLNLPPAAKRALVEGAITEGHARVLLTTDEPHKQMELLRLMLERHWNVRQAEEYARGYRGEAGSKMAAEARIAGYNQLTESLGEYLGARVMQRHTAKGGRIIIEYQSEDELDRIYRMIRHENND